MNDVIPEVVETSEVPEKVTVGEEAYTQEELSQLVGLGKMAKDVETRYHTKLDGLYPAYTKTTQELKELRSQKEEWDRQKAQQTVPQDQAQAFKEAKEAARKFGLIVDEDFDTRLSQSFSKYYTEQRQAEKLVEETDKLETTYSGSDGRPAFKKGDILQYMLDTGIRSPELAYKSKYEAELDTWKEQNLSKARKPGLVTETKTTAGSKVPSPVKITKDNLNELVRQSLLGDKEE